MKIKDLLFSKPQAKMVLQVKSMKFQIQNKLLSFYKAWVILISKQDKVQDIYRYSSFLNLSLTILNKIFVRPI